MRAWRPRSRSAKAYCKTLLAPFGSLGTLDEATSRALWRAIRDVTPFAANGPSGARDLWRISTAPTRGAKLAEELAAQAEAELVYDWAGGLIWAAMPAADDANATARSRRRRQARAAMRRSIRAPAAVRAKVDGVYARAPVLAALTEAGA